jgi:hypothetical protein
MPPRFFPQKNTKIPPNNTKKTPNISKGPYNENKGQIVIFGGLFCNFLGEKPWEIFVFFGGIFVYFGGIFGFS